MFLTTGADQHGRQLTAVCCLSSLNLETWFEWKDNPRFIEDVVRVFDNVVPDFVDRAPDEMNRAKYAAARERSVGLADTGFTPLQGLRVPSESVTAKTWNKLMFRHIRAAADAAFSCRRLFPAVSSLATATCRLCWRRKGRVATTFGPPSR